MMINGWVLLYWFLNVEVDLISMFVDVKVEVCRKLWWLRDNMFYLMGSCGVF